MDTESENNRCAGIGLSPLWLILIVSMAGCLIYSCQSAGQPVTVYEQHFDKAAQNGIQAHEGFVRSNRFMNAWISEADPESGLIPRNLDRDSTIWNAQDAAADNYPFMVLTSFFTDREKFDGLMLRMLDNEKRLTSRVGSLPDTYSFVKKGFEHDEVAMDRLLFGASEYIKDGLLPLTEWLGESPWSERMVAILGDMQKHFEAAGGIEKIDLGNSPEAEVHGEWLQTLSRLYWMIGEEEYLDWAMQIGDYYLLGKGDLLESDYLRLRDHGCEIISGLCELYVTLHFTNKEKSDTYRKPLHKLLDYILEHGRNDDGFFYNAINPQTGEVVDEGVADTWGYTLNGYYSVYMVDSVASYRDAITTLFENIHKYRNYDWERGSSDGYADTIESAINLYNRIPDPQVADWIDSEIKVMWSMQDSSQRANARKWKDLGIIEGWHGDGNFARTTIMYNLWKSKGIYLQPWREGIKAGATMSGDTLFISVESEQPWEGKVFFDKKRHATQMKLPVDWPRINQFPEWFTAEPSQNYQWLEAGRDQALAEFSGNDLIAGVDLSLEANAVKRIMVTPNQN